MSANWGGNVDERAVHEDLALVGVQSEGRRDLDEQVFCGTIRADHFLVL
jgi:hypothetical protein